MPVAFIDSDYIGNSIDQFVVSDFPYSHGPGVLAVCNNNVLHWRKHL